MDMYYVVVVTRRVRGGPAPSLLLRHPTKDLFAGCIVAFAPKNHSATASLTYAIHEMTEFGLIRPLEAGTTSAGASMRMMIMWWSTIGIEAFSVENSVGLGIVIGMRLNSEWTEQVSGCRFIIRRSCIR